ncbi:hypothetical protein NDU88_008736 [Pleurodeles waltl]|uniref:Uncharacterized protein n=1 Tax=Pleurodeles waltl TaxID=8319 RepID=A0AAV7PV82_PLEWA|nr:hypothetical protein NDU88_008736 [Pleurodeles waltl]
MKAKVPNPSSANSFSSLEQHYLEMSTRTEPAFFEFRAALLGNEYPYRAGGRTAAAQPARDSEASGDFAWPALTVLLDVCHQRRQCSELIFTTLQSLDRKVLRVSILSYQIEPYRDTWQYMLN